MRASTRLLFAVLTGLLFVLLVIAISRFDHWRIRRSQVRVVSAQATELDRQLLQLTIVPRLLSDDPRVHAALGESADGASLLTQRSANRLLEQVRATSHAAVVYVMDAQGKTVAASNWLAPTSFVGINYSFRPYFIGASRGQEATFFGVGATTGEPGYFIGHPVFKARGLANGDRDNAHASDSAGSVAGVVVVKVSLDALVDAWREQPHRSVVTDELGVSILSTDPDLLYRPSIPLDADARLALQAEKRYALIEQSGFDLSAAETVDDVVIDGVSQVWVRRPLQEEPWQLHLLVPRSRVTGRAILLASAIAGVVLIGVLLARLFRQQRRLAASEQRAARELEDLVDSRTRALESAQRALIAESNFAMLGRMSAAINHEINQPLASLRLDFATLRTLISREQPPLNDLRQTVVDGDRTIRRISRVIDTLRNLARQSGGEFETFDATRLLSDVVTTVRRERPRGAQALTVTAPAEVALLSSGNVVLLQQALLNLLHNAFDAVARQQQPSVELSLQSVPQTDGVGSELHYTVADNGPGVDAEVADRLFEPFATSSVRQSGLGLGLTLARQIAVDHGGSLIYRRAFGGGSIFVLTLVRSP